ncbi:MAG: lipopolysaccharide biosynthesis protein [Planctomycetaceae bacterium]
MTRVSTRTVLSASRSRFQQASASPLVRNTAWQYVSNILGAVIVFGHSLLVGRLLGVEQYGLMSLCLGFAGLVFNLVEFRLHEWVIRYLTEFWEARDLPRALATVRLSLLVDIVTGLAALGLVTALAPLTPLLFPELRGESYLTLLWLGGLVLFFANVGNATAIGLLRVFDGFRALALVKLSGQVFKLTATAAAILFLGWNVAGVLSIAVAASLLTTLGLGFVAHRELKRRIPLRASEAPIGLLRSRFTEMRSFALNVYGASLAAIPTRDLDVNLLGSCSTAAVIGAYKDARDFMAAIWQVSDPLMFVVYPELAKLWTRREFPALRRFLRNAVLGLAAGAFGLFAVAFSIVPLTIEFSLGEQFAEGGAIFRWMVWCLLVWMPLLWVNPLLMAAGRANLFFRATVVASATTLLLDLLLIPRLGATGAAIAYAAGVLASPLAGLWMARRAGILATIRSASDAD